MIDKAKRLLADCDALLIGAGAGLSTAAGLDYSEEPFRRQFPEWVERYGMTDLYTSSFYPFETEEERWAYWARHIQLVRLLPPVLPLYQMLHRLAEGKPHFVITTNVDAQFRKAGFQEERLFEVQGDYGLMQCNRACHPRLYPNAELVAQMAAQTHNCRVPSELVPRCPVCGAPMEINIRKDAYFVEDERWHAAADRYRTFLQSLTQRRRVVLLELGVGYNTPTIIRFPFDRLAHLLPHATLLRLNALPSDLNPEALYITGNLQQTLPKLCN